MVAMIHARVSVVVDGGCEKFCFVDGVVH